ncbi:MAG: DAK2 domain-containing protein [Caldisericia bacterium]|nr:DAK2 domain-containing protein [Caldisericia bacterium]
MNDFYKKIKEALFLTLKKLEEKENYINNLNVFPIPDGDTGTNMCKTLKETIESKYNLNELDFFKIIKEKIVLKAHGNSGIIFSQFLKGFIEEILKEDKDNFEKIKNGFEKGYLLSYEILDNPIEGTIITVIRESLKGLKRGTNINEGIRNAYFEGVKALEKTPELLKVLKDAHVVDAGGEGFINFLESLLYIFNNESYTRKEIKFNEYDLSIWRKRPNYRYCIEAFIENVVDMPNLKTKLKEFGNSIIVLKENNELKIHIHTNKVDEINKFLNNLGKIKEIISRDMRKQQLRFLHDIDIGIIAFSISDKISDLFYSLGATIVIDINDKPSLEEILETINDIPSQKIIILPNDKDLILTIKKAKDKTLKNLEYIETNFVTEGVEALLNFDGSLNFEDNIINMKKSIKNIKSGYIARADKSIKYKDLNIKEGDFFITFNNEIILSDKDPVLLFMSLLEIVNINKEEIILFFGNDLDFNSQQELRFKILNKYNSINLITYDGGQKIYSLIYSMK